MIASRRRLGTVNLMHNPVRLRLLDRNVVADVRVNEHEVQRRLVVGTPALCDVALLQVLVTLPAWEPFPWSMLDRREQRILRAAPEGVVDRSGPTATRLAVPATMVDAVEVEARSGTAGLLAASGFAPYCCRTAVIPAADADDETTLLNANLYGIGLAVRSARQVHAIVEPEPFVQRRWTWASWLFHEQAWAQLRLDRTVAVS